MRKLKVLKRVRAVVAALVILFSLSVLYGCSSGNDTVSDSKHIKIGFCAGPYSSMFKDAAQPSLEEKGYEIEIVEFSDYVQPNLALADKEIDANIYQNQTFLSKFIEEHHVDLTWITEIPTAPCAVYSVKYKTVDEIEDGAVCAIPNDNTNVLRAFRILEQTGLIKLDPDLNAGAVSVNDIAENPHNLKFTEVSAEVVTSVLDSVDLAVINSNYALAAGLKYSEAVYIEKLNDGYYNTITVRTEDVDSQLAKDLYDAVHSDEFRAVIEDETKEYSFFGRPADYEK